MSKSFDSFSERNALQEDEEKLQVALQTFDEAWDEEDYSDEDEEQLLIDLENDASEHTGDRSTSPSFAESSSVAANIAEGDEESGDVGPRPSIPLPSEPNVAAEISGPEKVLALNRALQGILEDHIETISGALQQNRQKQAELEEEMSTDDPKRKLAKGSSIGPFRAPYFRTDVSYPPVNEDVTLKRMSQEQRINPVRDHVSFKKRSREVLKKAVLEDTLEQLLRPLLMKLEAEVKKKEEVQDTVTPLQEQLQEQEERLTELKNEGLLKEGEARMELHSSITELRDKCEDRQAMVDEHSRRIEEIEEELRVKKSIPPEELLANVDPEKVDWMKISKMKFGGSTSWLDCQKAWENVVATKVNTSGWKKPEENELKKLVAESEDKDWKMIAQQLGTGRTAFQCFSHFQSYLNPEMKSRRWTIEEDLKLCSVANKIQACYGFFSWKKVSALMDSRSPSDCMLRFSKVDPGQSHGRWAPQEDARLIAAVEMLGPSWSKVAKFLGTRNMFQCRDRYINALEPNLNLTHFTYDEDIRLLRLHKEMGTVWSKMVPFFKGRTDGMLLARVKTLKRWQQQREWFDSQPQKVKDLLLGKRLPVRERKAKEAIVKDRLVRDLGITAADYRRIELDQQNRVDPDLIPPRPAIHLNLSSRASLNRGVHSYSAWLNKLRLHQQLSDNMQRLMEKHRLAQIDKSKKRSTVPARLEKEVVEEVMEQSVQETLKEKDRPKVSIPKRHQKELQSALNKVFLGDNKVSVQELLDASSLKRRKPVHDNNSTVSSQLKVVLRRRTAVFTKGGRARRFFDKETRSPEVIEEEVAQLEHSVPAMLIKSLGSDRAYLRDMVRSQLLTAEEDYASLLNPEQDPDYKQKLQELKKLEANVQAGKMAEKTRTQKLSLLSQKVRQLKRALTEWCTIARRDSETKVCALKEDGDYLDSLFDNNDDGPEGNGERRPGSGVSEGVASAEGHSSGVKGHGSGVSSKSSSVEKQRFSREVGIGEKAAIVEKLLSDGGSETRDRSDVLGADSTLENVSSDQIADGGEKCCSDTSSMETSSLDTSSTDTSKPSPSQTQGRETRHEVSAETGHLIGTQDKTTEEHVADGGEAIENKELLAPEVAAGKSQASSHAAAHSSRQLAAAEGCAVVTPPQGHSSKDGGLCPKDGGLGPKDGGLGPKDGGHSSKDGGHSSKDGGHSSKDGELGRKDGGNGSEVLSHSRSPIRKRKGKEKKLLPPAKRVRSQREIDADRQSLVRREKKIVSCLPNLPPCSATMRALKTLLMVRRSLVLKAGPLYRPQDYAAARSREATVHLITESQERVPGENDEEKMDTKGNVRRDSADMERLPQSTNDVDLCEQAKQYKGFVSRSILNFQEATKPERANEKHLSILSDFDILGNEPIKKRQRHNSELDENQQFNRPVPSICSTDLSNVEVMPPQSTCRSDYKVVLGYSSRAGVERKERELRQPKIMHTKPQRVVQESDTSGEPQEEVVIVEGTGARNTFLKLEPEAEDRSSGSEGRDGNPQNQEVTRTATETTCEVGTNSQPCETFTAVASSQWGKSCERGRENLAELCGPAGDTGVDAARVVQSQEVAGVSGQGCVATGDGSEDRSGWKPATNMWGGRAVPVGTLLSTRDLRPQELSKVTLVGVDAKEKSVIHFRADRDVFKPYEECPLSYVENPADRGAGSSRVKQVRQASGVKYMKALRETEEYRLLFARFKALFVWPGLLSTMQPPSIPQPPGPGIRRFTAVGLKERRTYPYLKHLSRVQRKHLKGVAVLKERRTLGLEEKKSKKGRKPSAPSDSRSRELRGGEQQQQEQQQQEDNAEPGPSTSQEGTAASAGQKMGRKRGATNFKHYIRVEPCRRSSRITQKQQTLLETLTAAGEKQQEEEEKEKEAAGEEEKRKGKEEKKKGKEEKEKGKEEKKKGKEESSQPGAPPKWWKEAVLAAMVSKKALEDEGGADNEVPISDDADFQDKGNYSDDD
ncbi:uncharacterized protein LOC101846210 isoform X2 [Aplysia californica]|uniref:Uncharacterized protein LOC101846210 isoform X2 n=1 Tax=Aplysia californica TaxID=6500 RepID=A0ABM0ZZ74_APLCA|nr:uncharacterized protein LOC101846210 isoform X2 [Aplysia californica]